MDRTRVFLSLSAARNKDSWFTLIIELAFKPHDLLGFRIDGHPGGPPGLGVMLLPAPAGDQVGMNAKLLGHCGNGLVRFPLQAHGFGLELPSIFYDALLLT